MNYRPDIEGLRAIAILLVVASHAGVPALDAGFIGVDVFFVISGYLITGLLAAEYARTGRIGIVASYARRFRRLLPALILMLLATALAVRLLLSTEEQAYQAMAGAAASAWVSNLYFAFGRIDYFGPASESNAYLHTWSLGVEEQFYLVWPLLLLLLLMPGVRGRGRWPALGMSMVLAISLAACLWGTQVESRYAFYLMPFRAWEFAAGALAWLLADRGGDNAPRDGWSGTWLGAVGAAMVALSLGLIGRDTVYPGAWALLPVLGTVCMLLAAGAGRNFVTRALSLAPMQALGKVSYSWYLWHWPVLVLGTVLMPAPNLLQRLLLAAWALIVAVLSYRLVEGPLRRNQTFVAKPGRWVLIALLLMLSSALLFTRWAAVTGSDRTPQGSDSPAQEISGVPTIYPMGCDDWYFSDRLFPCVFGENSAPRTAVVVGDSIGVQWFPAYEEIFPGPDWRLIVLTKSSCPMVDRPIFNARIGREFTECASWRGKVLDYVAELRPDVVVMGTTHTADFDRDEWVEGTEAVLARISPVAGKVFIMRSTPTLPFNGVQCIERIDPRTEDAWRQAMVACSAPAADPKGDDVHGWLEVAAARRRNVDIVDMNSEVCPGGICQAVQGRARVYRDNQHLDARFVRGLAGALRARMGSVVEGDGVEERVGSEER